VKKQIPKENQRVLNKGKKIVNLSFQPWLAQGQGVTKKVHP
jgi:hypothetical protein